MAGCLIQVASLIAGIEAGTQPGPVFYSGPDCNVSQFPAVGEAFVPSLINGTRLDLRAMTCKLEEGGPPSPFREPPRADRDFPPANTMSKKACPLPAIRSMIIPDGLVVTFFAHTDAEASRIVADPGVIVLSNTNEAAKKGIVRISTDFNTTLKWGSSVPDEKTKALGGPCAKSTGDAWYNSEGKMLRSLLSCGTPFWPSLASVILTGNESAPYALAGDGTRYFRGNAGTFPRVIRTDLDQYNTGRIYCRSKYGNTSGCASFGNAYPARFGCAGRVPSFTYSTGDCLAIKSDVQGDGDAPGDRANALCKPGPFSEDAKDFPPPSDFRCYCGTNRAINGSAKDITVAYEAGSWEAQQFLFCTSSKPMTLGGVRIRRYGQGTPACDAIVPNLCANSAFVSTVANAVKACTCVNEEIRLRNQFSGLNMPVQCFSAACSTNSPGVYRTAAQLENCSARICRQIIYISGSQISAEGYQSLLCNGQVYSVEKALLPIPTDGDSNQVVTGPTDLTLGPEFYIALGLLLFMVIILIVFAVRRFVVSRRAKQEENAAILSSLRNVVLQK